MPSAKKRRKDSVSTLVISGPQDFRKVSGAAELLRGSVVPTLRGGCDATSGKTFESESLEDDKASVASRKDSAKEDRPPLRKSSKAAPPLTHRHTAPPKMPLPHPLRLNPPEPSRAPPPPPLVELEGCSPPLSTNPGISSGDRALEPNRHSVIYGGFDIGSPFLPVIDQVEDMPLPESDSSASSGHVTPTVRSQSQRMQKAANRTRTSRLPAIGPLPLEMREPLKIWQKYTRTGVIDVEICPEALDSEGNYTWMHCWGLFNLYTFGASFMDDTEFADRVMDMLCKNLKPGKAADVDTIYLVFTGYQISSRLKQLVVDRCIDGEQKNFSCSITRFLPHQFAAVALEAAMERLTDSEWRQRLESPCRHHRHMRAEDCYQRKFANERDRRIIENKQIRKSQAATQIRPRLDTAATKKFPDAGDNGVELPVEGVAVSEPKHRHELVNDDRSSTMSDELNSIVSVQETDLDTDESSVVAALGLEDSDVSTAKSCEILKPIGRVSVVDVTNTSRPTESAPSVHSTSSLQLPVLESWLSLSESIGSEEPLLPGAYPKALSTV